MLLVSDTFSYPVFPRKGGMKWSYLSVSAHVITFNPKNNFNHISGRRRCLQTCENLWMGGRERSSGAHPATDGGDPSYMWPAQPTVSATLAQLSRDMQGKTQETKDPDL